MAFPFRALIACLLGLLPAGPHAAEPPMVPLTFRVASFASVPVVYYRPRPEASLQAIEMPTSAISLAHAYLGPVPMELFDSPHGREPVASVAVPAVARQLLILLTAGPGPSGSRLAALTVEDHASRFPSGSVGLINLAGRAYGAQLDREWLEVPPGLSGPAPAQGPMTLKLFARVADRWRRVTVFEIDFDPDARGWIILLPPYRPAELQPRLRLLFDRADPSPPVIP
jgi:hypothetical protein